MEVYILKKFKKFAYLLLIIIIVILAFTIYTNASQNNEKDDKQKTLTEIKFVESEIENLLNTMNNIEARNYKVTYAEISKPSDSSSSQGENQEQKIKVIIVGEAAKNLQIKENLKIIPKRKK